MVKKVLIILVSLAVLSVIYITHPPVYKKSYVELFTCPGCEQTILTLISSAKERIYCEMYILTNKKYIKALRNAKEKGVEILLLLDNNTYNRKILPELDIIGITYKLSDRFNLLHSKACVFDNTLFVGSHNWSYTSQSKNREINLITDSQDAVNEFLDVFWRDWNES